MAVTTISICSWLWVAFGVLWLIWSRRTKATQTRESVPSRLSYVVLTIAGFYLMFSNDVQPAWLRTAIFSPTLTSNLLGVFATAAGLGFAVWARAYLGGNWSGSVTVKVGHELVRTGPYRWVRHPIYSGMVLAILGTAVARHQVRGLVAVVLVYLGFKIKSKIEENAMQATFGPEYVDYSRGTGAILPRLRR